MKKFIIECGLFFLLIATCFVVGEILIPQSWVTFRNWEAFSPSRSDLFFGSFYPKYEQRRDELGELAHHTPFAVKKENIYWSTDELGYRNDSLIQDAEVLLIGASNVTGSGVSQENTLTNVLIRKTQVPIYNISPIYHFNQVVDHLKKGHVKKPKVLIYAILERGIPEFEPIIAEKISHTETADLTSYSEKSAWLRYFDRAYKKTLKNFTNARFNNSVGIGVQSPVNEKMFFIQGKNAISEIHSDYINVYMESIRSYQAFCDLNDITFVFVPIPNKETVYFEMVPFSKQPDFIPMLNKKLENDQIFSVDLLKELNLYKSKEMLYHWDDTHLSEPSLNLLADLLTPIILDQIQPKANGDSLSALKPRP